MTIFGHAKCIVAITLFSATACNAKQPHYMFLLPDGYVGWIQVIFNSPNAPALRLHHGRIVLKIDDSGVLKTRTLAYLFVGSHDEFFYKRVNAKGKEVLARVPSNYYCNEMSGIDSCYGADGTMSDGFTVGRATLGRSDDGSLGNSWFLFVGPPDLRAKMAKQIHRAPGKKYQIDVPEDDPQPGMISVQP